MTSWCLFLVYLLWWGHRYSVLFNAVSPAPRTVYAVVVIPVNICWMTKWMLSLLAIYKKIFKHFPLFFFFGNQEGANYFCNLCFFLQLMFLYIWCFSLPLLFCSLVKFFQKGESLLIVKLWDMTISIYLLLVRWVSKLVQPSHKSN